MVTGSWVDSEVGKGRLVRAERMPRRENELRGALGAQGAQGALVFLTGR